MCNRWSLLGAHKPNLFQLFTEPNSFSPQYLCTWTHSSLLYLANSIALLWVELYPPQIYVEVLTPGACDCVIWKQGICRRNQIMIRSYGIRVGPKPNKWFFNKETEVWRHTQGRKLCDSKGFVTMEAVMQLYILLYIKDRQQSPQVR